MDEHKMTAQEAAREYAHRRFLAMGLMRFDYEAGVIYEMRDAYLAGYEAATAALKSELALATVLRAGRRELREPA